MKTISIENFKQQLLENTPIIDVRAAIEFKAGSIPGSINIPVLNDQERHEVGTCYKKQGKDAAIKLGHQFVSGENLKQKLDLWKQQLEKNPQTIITCLRGGLRSQSTQKFLKDAGVEATRLEKGYKSARQLFIDQLQDYTQQAEMLILSGTTGSGKTHLLDEVKNSFPIIDLEALACHRGSAFGAMNDPQPAQVDFENRLALATMKLESSKTVLLEDESRLIGSCYIPEFFFTKMRSSNVILIQEPLENRVENIFTDYITSQVKPQNASQIFAKYKNSILKIQKKLGGLRAQELIDDLQNCENDYLTSQATERNKIWIEKLLVWYYDKMYLSSLETRKPTIQFQGTRPQVTSFIKELTILK